MPVDFNVEDYIVVNSEFEESNKIHTIVPHTESIATNSEFEESNKIHAIVPHYEPTGNNVFHITHNFGGGTHVYINNLINIFKNYRHYIVKIMKNETLKIDNLVKGGDVLNVLKTASLVIVHSVLFDNNECLAMSNNAIDIIRSVECKKILIVHDYFLFDPSNPNPIKSELSNKYPMDEAKNFLHIFDKVFFNSVNCYENYIKVFSKINNFHILNVTPDINFYKERILPEKKEIYNIGLIGDIGCLHKGRNLASKIITMFNSTFDRKYNFTIFGNYDPPYSNLKITGKYKNEDIFSMIKNEDIDYFLFVSVFEETYSFALSIALHTGLPIIYNNIGSYSERLENYKNCFPFSENNLDEIIKIFEDIDMNITFKRTEKNLPTLSPALYNNIPEFSNYLTIDNEYNFNMSEIEKNLNFGNVCFIHVCNSEIFGETSGIQIFKDQISYIKESGLYDKLDYIFVTLLGKNALLTHDYKIKLIYYSENISEWELPHMKRIQYFSQNISKNIKILQIHTKGVTCKPHAYEWRKYLEYYLIEKNEICLRELDNFKCVGVNHHFYYNNENKYRNHFSGNFWWANSSYMKNLENIEITDDRWVIEHWLIGRLDKYDYRNFLSMHQTPIDFYESHLENNKYNLELIKSSICSKLKTKFVKSRNIYGLYFICCIGDYLNIVKNQLDKLVESRLYNKTDKIYCFVCQKQDDCIKLLQQYNKIEIIATEENLYEKYAINFLNKYKKDICVDYYLYYMHSKSVTRSETCYTEWRNLCDYFTIKKWRLSIELLQYYDCVGTNLKTFPKKHYSGNYWWSKSEHLNILRDINDGYLSCEMYIMSNMKTNYVSIYQTYVNHGDTNYPEQLYNSLSDSELINNFCIIPDFNPGDKKCIKYCGDIDPNFEPAILELE